MALRIVTEPGLIRIGVTDVDDSCKVIVNNDNLLVANMGESKEKSFTLSPGDTVNVKYEVYNPTGGRFHTNFVMTGPRGRLDSRSADGWTLPGQTNIAFEADLVVQSQ